MCVDATGSDFTEQFWLPEPAGQSCKTAFTPLPTPKLFQGTVEPGQTALRSDQYQTSDNGMSVLTGNVKVQQDNMLLLSQNLVWVERGPLVFDQGLAIYHPRAAASIDFAQIDQDPVKKTGKLTNVSFVALDFPLQGKVESMLAGEDTVVAEDISLSSCDPRDERWSIRAKRVTINRETDRVWLRGATLNLGKLPIFYLPIVTFRPHEIRNGFNRPRITYKSDNGLIIKQPIRYIRDGIELTFEPRYLQKNGLQWGLETVIQDWRVNADWLREDRKRTQMDELGDDLSRWRLETQYQQSWQNWEAEIDITKTSDFGYQHDFEFDQLIHPEFAIESFAELRYLSRDWRINLTAQRFNSTSDDEILGERVPELDVKWFPYLGPVSASTHVNLVRHLKFGDSYQRLHVEQELRLDRDLGWGGFEFGANAARTRFRFHDNPALDATRELWSYQTAGSLFFDKYTETSRLTLLPRFYYLNREIEDEPLFSALDTVTPLTQRSLLFGDSRRAGLDSIPADHKLATGISLRSAPFGDNRREFGFDLAYNRYFPSREEAGNYADWGASVYYQNNRDFLFEHTQYYSRQPDSPNQFETLAVYEPRANKQMYVSYGRNAGSESHQSEIGLRTPMLRRWELLSAVRIDWDREDIVEGFAGLAFNGCCYRTEIVLQRGIDWNYMDGAYRIAPETRLLFRFDFNGIGSLSGRRLESLLARQRFHLR